LENAKEVVAEFEKRMNIEVRQQEKLNIVEERYIRREKLSGKFIAKILYSWDDEKFEEEYLRKLKIVDSNYFQFLSYFYFLLLLFLF